MFTPFLESSCLSLALFLRCQPQPQSVLGLLTCLQWKFSRVVHEVACCGIKVIVCYGFKMFRYCKNVRIMFQEAFFLFRSAEMTVNHSFNQNEAGLRNDASVIHCHIGWYFHTHFLQSMVSHNKFDLTDQIRIFRKTYVSLMAQWSRIIFEFHGTIWHDKQQKSLSSKTTSDHKRIHWSIDLRHCCSGFNIETSNISNSYFS